MPDRGMASMLYRFLLLVPLFTMPGCVGPTELDIRPDAPILFLVRRAPPTSVMEALYQGRVEVDQQGCLRLGLEPERHTVVWPFGSRLASDKTGLIVLDQDGDRVTEIGALVRLSGGEVAGLPDESVLTEEFRAAAQTRCPGRFWIVGDVLPPQAR